jgi:nicotinamide mononucleotide transporter
MDFSAFLGGPLLTPARVLEFSGLVTGLACVALLIRQNIWTWPLGIVYVLISIWIFLDARLYADLLLHVLFLVLNVYGWYYWLRGGEASTNAVPVTRAGTARVAALCALAACGTAVFGWCFATYTDAALPYWDNATTCLSLAAMWLSTRKHLENWVLWWVVDVLATGIYFYKGLYFYALLYLVYTGLAVLGFRAWRRSLAAPVRWAVA